MFSLVNSQYVWRNQMFESDANALTFRTRFVMAVSAVGLLGFVGNGLLLCFYGNQRTRIYRSRDAIYIRRIAYSDLLVCSLVLPYTVFFEVGLIRSDPTCKSLEFMRHFLTYMAHLLLITYSWELPQRHLYTDSQTYSLNTFIFSFFVSVLGSAPTVFLFRVTIPVPPSSAQPPTNSTEEQLSATQATPPAEPTCQLAPELVLSFDALDVKQSLMWMYFLVPAVVYTVCLYWYLANLIAYLNYLELAQKSSIFLTNLEDIHEFDSPVLSGTNKKTRRLSGKTTHDNGSDDGRQEVDRETQAHRDLLAAYGFIKSDSHVGSKHHKDLPSYLVAYGEKSNYRRVSFGGSSNSSTADCTIFTSKSHSNKNNSSIAEGREGFKKNISFQEKQPRRRSVKKQLRLRRPTGFAGFLGVMPSDSDSQEEETSDGKISPKVYIVEEDIGNATEGNSKLAKRRQRPILTSEKFSKVRHYPRVGSYKKSLAGLILFDLILIPWVICVFMLLGDNSVFLSLLHLKSVVTFYALSTCNPYLRDCVFGSKTCSRGADDKSSSTATGASARPSAMQVRFVRERFKLKQEHKKLRQQMHQVRQAQDMATSDGTAID